MKALLLAVLLTGCATTTGAYSDGCERIFDPAAPAGFTVYSCPHAFPKLVGVSTQEEHPGARLGGVQEFEGLTDCANRTVYVHDTYMEVLAHEYTHARACK
jgi:hypothetical protein